MEKFSCPMYFVGQRHMIGYQFMHNCMWYQNEKDTLLLVGFKEYFKILIFKRKATIQPIVSHMIINNQIGKRYPTWTLLFLCWNIPLYKIEM